MTQTPHEETITTTTMDDPTREDPQESSYRPAEHFLELSGGRDKKTKYLPVAHRVHWFNQELSSSFEIRTEIVYHAPDKPVTVDVERWVGEYPHKRKEVSQVTKPGEVIVKATVIDHAHFKQATAHKYECVANFVDALEKAETGAIGRALALLGYGTLAAELDEGRIVDSPIESDEGRNGQRHAPTPPPPPALSLLNKALAIPGIKRGLPPTSAIPTSSANGKGGKPTTTNTNGTVPPPAPAPSSVVPYQKNGATPSASAVPPPPTPSVEEMRGAIKDYELSVPSDVFIHFILAVCKQPAKRAEWNIAQIYKELLVWQAGGEQQWRAGVVTSDLVEKLKKIMEAFPKASVAAFRARLPFLHQQQQQEGKTFSDCTTEEVLSVIEMMREVSYLHDMGAVYDVFVDPARKARISFHHLKTEYNVDHPLDLMVRGGQEEEERRGGGDPLAPVRSLFAYQKFLEGAYSRKPDSFSADLCKRYANRLPALPVEEQVAAV